jgi:hypothetical protein
VTRLPIVLLFALFCQTASAELNWVTPCADRTFCLNPGSCNLGNVFFFEQAVSTCGSFVSYSHRIDLFNDGSTDIQSSADTVMGNFAKGTHKITWRANDNCGTVIQCTYLFIVKDCSPPAISCLSGFAHSLEPPCQVTFSPSQFLISYSDNCTPTANIQLAIRRSGTGTGFPTTDTVTFYSCDEGARFVDVWARDGDGAVNSCTAYILLQDSDNDCYCNPDGDLAITGCARTAGGKKMSSYRIKTTVQSISGLQPPLLENAAKTITDSCYSLSISELPFGANYRAVVRAERFDAHLNGVSTLDLVAISRHILGTQPFTSAYQVEAADVSNNDAVSGFDIVETRKLILGIYDTFPAVPAWRLVRPLANPSVLTSFIALQDTYQITLNNLADDLTLSGNHFVGIKYGDVSQEAQFAERAAPRLLRTDERWLAPGEEVSVPIRWSEAATLSGWQMSLRAAPDALELLAVEGLPAEDFSQSGNTLRALWFDSEARAFADGEILFSLKIKALRPIWLSRALHLDGAPPTVGGSEMPNGLRPEAYLADGTDAVERQSLRLQFGAGATERVAFFPPQPNPFAAQTTFEILLESPASATLEVFDLDGRRVFAEQYELESGLQSLVLRAAHLPRSGLFAYRLRVGDSVSVGRLVRG